jgi:ribosomal protein S18 acetylase RimI-like enzyme
MPVTYRTARADELERAQVLVLSSISDLTERHGFGRMTGGRPPHFQTFSLRDDPDGLWVAEEGEAMLGFAFSWACGDLWFLAELFVSPGQQGRGIGNELLKRTFEHAKNTGATNKALITFPFNTVSQGLYIRHGMFPRDPIYNFAVPREALLGRLRGPQYRCAALESSASHLKIVTEIDVRNLGVSREKHHRFLLSDSTTRGVLLHDGNDCVGYAYVNSSGHVGPLAVTRRGVMGTALRTVLGLAAEGGSTQVSAFLPGSSDAALSTAVELGMRITLPMLLMSSRDFGDWAQYLPRNPGFM